MSSNAHFKRSVHTSSDSSTVLPVNRCKKDRVEMSADFLILLWPLKHSVKPDCTKVIDCTIVMPASDMCPSL